MMLGHAIPFVVTKTLPLGIVKVSAETKLTILSDPPSEGKTLQGINVRETEVNCNLTKQCPGCRAQMLIDAKFCGFCGTNLQNDIDETI